MNKLKNILLVIFAFFLTSCLSTTYQRNGFTGGYTDNRIDDTTYHISFRGNGFTSKQTVENYAKKRAAEIGINIGYRYFIILNSLTDAKSFTINNTITKDTSGNANLSRNRITYNENSTYRDNSVDVDKYSSDIYVKFFIEKPELDIIVYDALSYFPERKAAFLNKSENLKIQSYENDVLITEDAFESITTYSLLVYGNDDYPILISLEITEDLNGITFTLEDLSEDYFPIQIKMLLNDQIIDSNQINSSLVIFDRQLLKPNIISFLIFPPPEIESLTDFQLKFYRQHSDVLFTFTDDEIRKIEWFLVTYRNKILEL